MKRKNAHNTGLSTQYILNKIHTKEHRIQGNSQSYPLNGHVGQCQAETFIHSTNISQKHNTFQAETKEQRGGESPSAKSLIYFQQLDSILFSREENRPKASQ